MGYDNIVNEFNGEIGEVVNTPDCGSGMQGIRSPYFCPQIGKKSKDFKIEIDSYESIFFVVRKELVINIKIKISDIYDESVVPIKDFM